MNAVLLEARGLCKVYPARGLSRTGKNVAALDGVDLLVEKGSCLAIVGESGSGKSTLARLLLALEAPTAGRVDFDGVAISSLQAAALRPLRRRFQAVFQDPTESLNPKLRVATIVAEALVAHAIGTPAERQQRVAEVLTEVGLDSTDADRFPAAFSAGERQRIAIARALAPSPDLLVLDEPVASLDATVQARILALVHRLRQDHGLTIIFVSHDLAVVREISERVCVMYRGVIVEEGPTERVLSSPAHPYTRDLLASSPGRGSASTAATPTAAVEPSPFGLAACRYAGRCADREPRCATEPTLEEVGTGHRVACWVRDRLSE